MFQLREVSLEIVWLGSQDGAGRFGMRHDERIDCGTVPRAPSEQGQLFGRLCGT